MSDKETVDFDTLPTKAEDIMDEDLDEFDEEEDEKGFNDEADPDEENELAETEGDEEESEEEAEEDVEQEEDGEDDEYDESDEDDESPKKSVLKEVLLWGGVSIGVIGGGVYYFDTVLGFNLIGNTKQEAQQNTQEKSEIEILAEENRNITSSEVIKKRDSEEFNINEGWENNTESSVNGNSKVMLDDQSDKDSQESDDNPAVTLPTSVKNENKDSVNKEPSQQDLVVDNESLVEKIREEIKGVVDSAVSDLLTKKDFESGISNLSTDISESFSDAVEKRESQVMEALSELSNKQSSMKDRQEVDLSGRQRIPNINVLDGSSNGEMSVVKNSTGGTNVLGEGETFSINGENYKVSEIMNGGRLVLVGKQHYIDGKRVVEKNKGKTTETKQKSQEAKATTNTSMDRKRRIERFKAEKRVAESLRRDYGVSLAAREIAMRQMPTKKDRPSINQTRSQKDYVISTKPIDDQPSSNYQEIPSQEELIIAEGWKGSMIMGNEYLVTDPKGNWRKLRNGERVIELDNNLVHGLDNKNNLIVGNHVILFK